jgi:hypothetical protein
VFRIFRCSADHCVFLLYSIDKTFFLCSSIFPSAPCIFFPVPFSSYFSLFPSLSLTLSFLLFPSLFLFLFVLSHTTSQKSSITQDDITAPAPVPAPAPAIKKGFLNTAKSTVYPESVTAKNKKPVNSIFSPAIILPSKTSSERSDNRSLLSSTNGLLRTDGVVSTVSGSMVQELSAEELQQLKKTGTVRKTQGQGQTQATVLSSSAPSVSTSSSAAVGAVQAKGTEKSVMNSNSNDNSSSSNSSSSSSSSSSSNGISSPRSSQSPQNDPQSPSNRPQYSLIERGLVSMGDFETLKDKVASNRYCWSRLHCAVSYYALLYCVVR